MTKVSVFRLSEKNVEQNKKPIEFIKQINLFGEIVDSGINPGMYENVTLLCRNYCKGLDLIFAYDNLDNPTLCLLVLGHWNDGIV